MHGTMPVDLEQFVERELASGKYRTREELVESALRHLCERERKLAALRADIQVGLDDVAAGRVFTLIGEPAQDAFFDDVKARGRARSEAKEDAG